MTIKDYYMIQKTTLALAAAAALASIPLCGGCSRAQVSPSVSWEWLTPAPGENTCRARFKVSSPDSVARLCFNQLPRDIRAVSPGDSVVEIAPGYYYITSPKFASGAPEAVIDVEYTWVARADAERPESFHAITPGGRLIPVDYHPVSLLDQTVGNPQWDNWTVSADSIYRLNSRLLSGHAPGPFDIVPSFKKVTPSQGTFSEGLPVREALTDNPNPEFYRITLTPDSALIEGASPRALKMARRTLSNRLLAPNGGSIPCAVIEDWPDYPYRALMIDIARNFLTPAEMRKITENMADLRLNTLHFHITDDETWRLEIPGLPELTDVGSRRGYTLDSKDFLPQVFTGDGNPDSREGTANGFFSRNDFISFIRHCDSIGIAVIPEIESPGHARAAIKSMEARFRRTGDDTFRLIDPADTSRYTSAQLYHDNLMNPAVPGTYAFIAKVVDEVEAMYHEAGVPLPGIHLGGDEVPEGAWDGSPLAMKMAEERGVSGRHGLQGEYVKKIARIMRDRNIPLFGWQDIATGYDAPYHTQVAPQVGGINCWVSSLDPDKNVAIQGVRAGYPVILSNVNFFYMDMLYTPHPQERGLYWGGFVDELQALSGYPDRLCPPQPGAKGKIIGVSGQLFGETLRNPAGAETLLFPKSLGLAERGWNATPTYSPEDFSMLIGTKELPRLAGAGVRAHLKAPGIIVKDGKILMNAPYPGCDIRYTLDGSVPSEDSPLYSAPVPLPADCAQVRAVCLKDGFSSVETLMLPHAAESAGK